MYQKLLSLNNNVLCYCKMPHEKFEIINREFAEMFTLVKEAAQHRVQRIGLLARLSKWFGAIASR